MKVNIPNDDWHPGMEAWLHNNVGATGWKDVDNRIRDGLFLYSVPYKTIEIFDEQQGIIFKLTWL